MMPYRVPRIWLLASVMAWLGAGQGPLVSVGATAEAWRIADVDVGFAGQYKVGYWTPVAVAIVGGGGQSYRVELVATDSDGVPVTYRGADRSLESGAGSRWTCLEYVKFGRARPALDVRLVVDGQVVDERRVDSPELAAGLGTHQPLLVTARESVELEAAARLVFSPNEPAASVVVPDTSQLPDQWYGYEAVHTLVLTTSDLDWLSALNPAQVRALDTWIRQGGRVILSVGVNGTTLVARGQPWTDWIPGTCGEVGQLRRTSAIETYAAAEQRLGGAGREVRIDMALLTDVSGRVDCTDTLPTKGEYPLVVRVPCGLGQIVFVAIDVDRPPLSEWPGRPRFLAKVLQFERAAQIDLPTRESLGQVVHLGFDDLVGQLRGALDQFPGVKTVAFGWIVTLIVAYILLLGPGEYFLHRKLGRAERTWVTFPLLVLALAGLAFWLKGQLRERRLRVNQVDVVDVDVATGQARGTTWVNIYSPESIRSDWSLSPPTVRDDAGGGLPTPGSGHWLLSWQGVPGRGVGALGSSAQVLLSAGSYTTRLPATAPPNADRSTDQPPPAAVDQGRIESLPVAVASTRILSGRWCGTLPLSIDGRLSSDSPEGQLQGRLKNPWPFRLEEWALLRGNWLYRGDRDLEPGAEIVLNEYSTPRYLDWYLTRRRVSTEHKDVSTPWDDHSLDVPRIVEMILFHRSAGGAAYTRVGSRYQQYLDLTEQLRLGRAVLVGRGPLACRPLRDGTPLDEHLDQQVAFYRVVIPVEVESARAKP